MDNLFNALAQSGLDPLYIYLGSVFVDNLLGVLQSFRTNTFDLHKLPSFLESQFATAGFLSVASAAIIAAFSSGDNLSAIHDAALAVVLAGGGAMTLANFKDIYNKLVTLITGK